MLALVGVAVGDCAGEPQGRVKNASAVQPALAARSLASATYQPIPGLHRILVDHLVGMGWAEQQLLDRQFCFLLARVRGISGTWKMSFGTKRGNQCGLDGAVDLLAQRVVQRRCRGAAPQTAACSFAAQVLQGSTTIESSTWQGLHRAVQPLVPMRRPWRLMVASLRP